MGGLRKKIPITFWTFLIATIAISGIPGFSGFFSKDEILWKTFASGHIILWILASITAGLTAFYMFRLVYLTFFGEFRGGSEAEPHVKEVSPLMTSVLIVLAFFSVFGGHLAIPESLGGHFVVGKWLEPVLEKSRSLPSLAYYKVEHEKMLELGLMAGSVMIALLGIGLATLLFWKKKQERDVLLRKPTGFASLLENKYWVDEIYEALIVRPINSISVFFWKVFDGMAIDGFINGTGQVAVWVGGGIRRIQTGLLSNYALFMSVAIAAVVGWMIFGR